jgi:hypothetical protein
LRRADSALRETIFQLLTIIGTLPSIVPVGTVASKQQWFDEG